MRNPIKFGTYGFLATMLAAQMASISVANSSTANEIDRKVVDAKKSGRAVRRDVKKAGRKMTGQDSKVEDFKDSAGDTVENAKDEIDHAKKQAE